MLRMGCFRAEESSNVPFTSKRINIAGVKTGGSWVRTEGSRRTGPRLTNFLLGAGRGFTFRLVGRDFFHLYFGAPNLVGYGLCAFRDVFANRYFFYYTSLLRNDSFFGAFGHFDLAFPESLEICFGRGTIHSVALHPNALLTEVNVFLNGRFHYV